MSKKQAHIDPRVVRTKALLRNALMELIPEKGYNAITIKDITDRATLNRATFYLHYKDKDDLLYHGMREVLDELNPKQPFPQSDSEGFDFAATYATIQSDFEHVREHAAFYEVMLGENAVWGFVHELQNYVYEQTSNRVRDFRADIPLSEVDLELVLRHLSAAYVGVVHWWIENDMPYTPAEMAEKLVALYREGLYRSLGFKMSGAGHSM